MNPLFLILKSPIIPNGVSNTSNDYYCNSSWCDLPLIIVGLGILSYFVTITSYCLIQRLKKSKCVKEK